MSKKIFFFSVLIFSLLIQTITNIANAQDIYSLAKSGKIDEIKTYFEKNKVQINKPDKSGKTLLSYVLEAKEDRLDVLEYLLEKGADMNFVSWRLLDITIENNNYKMLERALKSYKKDVLFSPLSFAVYQSSLQTVKVLIEHALKTDTTKKWDDGLILEAFDRERNEIAKYLISKKLDINYTNYEGQTALHYACKGKFYYRKRVNPELIKILIDAGANLNIVDNNGDIPLMFLVKSNIPKETVIMMIDKGADVKLANKRNETILHTDYLYGNADFNLLKNLNLLVLIL